MKVVFIAALLGALASGETNAQQLPASADEQALPAWEALSPKQRDQIVAPLRERWNRSPDERAKMLQRAQRWQAMTQEQRTRAQRGLRRWEKMQPQERRRMRTLFEHSRHLPEPQRRETLALYHRMRGMTHEQRKTLRDEWATMSAAQRRAWMEANPVPLGDEASGNAPPKR